MYYPEENSIQLGTNGFTAPFNQNKYIRPNYKAQNEEKLNQSLSEAKKDSVQLEEKLYQMSLDRSILKNELTNMNKKLLEDQQTINILMEDVLKVQEAVQPAPNGFYPQIQ